MNDPGTSLPSTLLGSTGDPLRLQVNWRHVAMWAVLIGLFGLFLRAVQPILMPFVLGMVIAYMVDPIANRLNRWGIRRNISAAIITISIFALFIAMLVWLGPLLYHQLIELVTKIPSLLKQIEQSTRQDTAPLWNTIHALAVSKGEESIPGSVSEVVQRVVAAMGSVFGKLLSSAATIVNIVALLLIAPIVCFYLIRDWHGVIMRANRLLPLAYAPTIREQLGLINKTLAAYLRGQMTVVALLTVYHCVALTMVGINYALLLGLLAGFFAIVPYIGTFITIGLGLMIAYGQFGIDTHFWIIAAIYGFGNILESQILTPGIIGDRVGLHPLWMLFGMLSGAVLFGFVGVMLAVPLTAVISVLVKFVISRYLDSTLYTQR